MTNETDEELISKAKHVFVDLMVGDVKRTFDANILIGSLVLSLCAVDTLACFAADKPNGEPIRNTSGKHFKEFVKEFMDDKYTPIAGKLYGALRGFLIHSYTTRYFVLTDHEPHNHLKMATGIQGEKRQLLNIDSLIEDVEKAATTYVDRLQKDPALLTNFKIQYQYAGLMSVFNVEIAEYFVSSPFED